MKYVSLRKAMKEIGLTEIKISNGYYEQSGFGKDSNGQVWYVNTGDWRLRQGNSDYKTLIRTAKDYKDYVGGCNQYWMDDKLAEKGFAIAPKA